MQSNPISRTCRRISISGPLKAHMQQAIVICLVSLGKAATGKIVTHV